MSFKWYGDHIKTMIEIGVKQNLVKCGQDLQNKSANQAPKDTGDLRGNCAVDTSNLDNMQVRVGYNLSYALIQHEEMDYRHTDGKAKFLEDPFNENKEKYVKYCGEGLLK